jgi:isopentenyl diphosphate isomerase/L-lactate dehydrogenase-like FMN-dependent dehydrogenase
VAEGLDAIVVSNHCGRQLDGAPATAMVLPEIVQAVARRLEVYVDGGIRTGMDIAKVIAMGARSAMVGRATLYGVAAEGAEGTRHALRLLRSQYDRALALLGCRDLLRCHRLPMLGIGS